MEIKFQSVRICLLLILFLGCNDEFERVDEYEVDYFLNLYCDLYQDENEIYHIEYDRTKSNSYSSVFYNTNPNQFVSWYSPNEFYVIHFQDTIYTPIIDYTTYSREDGSGKQLFYLSPQHIGDTLDLYGIIDDEVWDMVKVWVI